LAGARTRSEVAEVVFERGLAVLGASSGALVLRFEHEPGHVEIVEQFGYPEPLIDAWRRFPSELSSPVTDAIRTGETVWVQSPAVATEKYPAWGPAVTPGTDRAWAALPLTVGATTFGALGLGYAWPRAFTQEYRDVLSSVANRCAIALERAAAIEDRQRTIARLQLAQDASGIGIHDYDVRSGTIHWDERVRGLWGVSPDEPVTYGAFMRGLHPEDRAPTQEAVDRALDPQGPGEYLAEYRVLNRRDHCERWILATGKVFFEAGRPARLVGTVLDVTSQRQSQQALVESRQRLELALAAGRIGIWEWNVTEDVVLWSPETHDVMGVPRDVPIRETAAFFALVHPDDLDGVRERLRAAAQGNDGYEHQFRIRRPDGAIRWVATIGRAERDTSGRTLRVVGTVRDVTEEREAEAALRSLDARRTEFLAVLSHELRNPLAPMQTSLLLLDRVAPESDTARRAREILNRQTKQLARLVDDLLDASRFVHGKIELRLERIDAREVARRVCEDVRATFEQRGVALLHRDCEEPAWVDADPARLAQMVSNLLNNALKFTPTGGRVEVVVSQSFRACEIEVRDTGVGISAEELPRVFTPFMQADRTRARSQGGLGLGLALVSELAKQHGGAARARSEGTGRGAAFVIELPLAPAPNRS
jgi:PAS domain S-box-containing protein